MAPDEKQSPLPVFFYRTRSEAEPVRDWLRGLPDADRRVFGFDLRRVQKAWPIGMPLCRSLGRGLWEVRSNLPSRRIGRLIFFVEDGEIYVVHGFIKKSQKTPARILRWPSVGGRRRRNEEEMVSRLVA